MFSNYFKKIVLYLLTDYDFEEGKKLFKKIEGGICLKVIIENYVGIKCIKINPDGVSNELYDRNSILKRMRNQWIW